MTSPANANLATISEAIAQCASNLEKLKAHAGDIARAGDIMIEALRRDCAIYFCGNGGSAADAQHLAAELSAGF